MSSFPAIDVATWVVRICGGLTTKTAYSELKSTRKRKQRKSIIFKVLLVERVRGYFGNSRAKVVRLGAEKILYPLSSTGSKLLKHLRWGFPYSRAKTETQLPDYFKYLRKFLAIIFNWTKTAHQTVFFQFLHFSFFSVFLVC